jgi:protein tyrosine phosphatase (PTP) superfamily phosphohydrolase (DUF442 family)
VQFEQQVNGQRLVASTPELLEAALSQTKESIKAGEGFPCIVDLRKKLEMGEFPASRCKDAGISYLHLPVTPESLSEQDIDHVRREFGRNWGRVLVISTHGQRAVLMVAMQAARVAGIGAADAAKKFPELTDPALKQYLEAYLNRHQVGYASV